MWLAKCDYVRLLKDPNIFETLMDTFTSNCTLKGRLGCDGRGRFSAEHWIHSHPTVKVSCYHLRHSGKIVVSWDVVLFFTAKHF